MAEYTCVQVIHFKADEERKKGSFTTRDEPTSSSDFNISFNFICKPWIFEWVLREDSEVAQFMRNFDLPTIKKHIRINQVRFLGEEKAREIIDEEIKYLGVGADNRRLLIDFALEKVWEVVKSMPPSHNTVHLNIHVMSVHKHTFDERSDIRTAMQLSMEEAEDCLVPAADSSIEALEKKRIILILEDSEACSICLEEFSEGCEGICMPCSHVFHGECIKEWLRTSHYCPLCRFEMPTS